MATENEKIRGLHGFFVHSFTASELKDFLTLNGYQEIASAVNQSVGGNNYFLEVIQALSRRGLIDEEFFVHLTRERPRKEASIRSLQASWLLMDSMIPPSSGNATPSDPRKIIHPEPPAPRQQTSVTPATATTERDRPDEVPSPAPLGFDCEPMKDRARPAPRTTPEPGAVASPNSPGGPRTWHSRVAMGALALFAMLGIVVYITTVNGTAEGLVDPKKIVPTTKLEKTTSPEPQPEITKAVPTPPAPAPRDAESITTGVGGIRLKLISAGTFLRDSPDGEGSPNEHPQREIRISAFYLGIHEVTQSQYQAVMDKNPSYFSSAGEGKDTVGNQSTDQHPVETVSWMDAVQFCNDLSKKEGLTPFYAIKGTTVTVPDWQGKGYRLPTEAEWEYACRAGSTAKYSFGDDPKELGEHAWYDGNSKINGNYSTHPVGQKRENKFGLFDMHGNVWEWCWDGYDKGYYKTSSDVDPKGPDSGIHRVLRGGSYNYNPTDLARPTASGSCRASATGASASVSRGLTTEHFYTFTAPRISWSGRGSASDEKCDSPQAGRAAEFSKDRIIFRDLRRSMCDFSTFIIQFVNAKSQLIFVRKTCFLSGGGDSWAILSCS